MSLPQVYILLLQAGDILAETRPAVNKRRIKNLAGPRMCENRPMDHLAENFDCRGNCQTLIGNLVELDIPLTNIFENSHYRFLLIWRSYHPKIRLPASVPGSYGDGVQRDFCRDNCTAIISQVKRPHKGYEINPISTRSRYSEYFRFIPSSKCPEKTVDLCADVLTHSLLRRRLE